MDKKIKEILENLSDARGDFATCCGNCTNIQTGAFPKPVCKKNNMFIDDPKVIAKHCPLPKVKDLIKNFLIRGD